MKKILLMPVFAIACLFLRIDSAWAIDYPFSVTTTNISANGTFQFMLSAQGTFYVDCGTGGTLSGAGVSGGTINRTSTTNLDTYTCTYSTAGVKTIRFGGLATGYRTGTHIVTISFCLTNDNTETNAPLVSSISGNMSTIFPYLGPNAGQAPSFYLTFAHTSIRSIPDTLFSGYSGNLIGADYMFAATFYSTTIVSIPDDLFRGITGGGTGMFQDVFAWSSVRSIPEHLFSDITFSSQAMFNYAFRGTAITSIPDNLFSGITTGAEVMFFRAFSVCNLTSLPKNLFANITTSAANMFVQTFADNPRLSGYVPKTLFAGLIANNSPYSTDMFTDAFSGTNLDTSCPAGTTTFTTVYEQYWGTGNGNAVSCDPNIISMTFDGATTTPATCSFGSTFVPPTPTPRPGYVFTGWKVKTVNP